MTKTLQLNLQKRILIVELPRLADYEFINRESKYLKVGNEEINLNIPTLSKMEIVCKGDELNEYFLSTSDIVQETKVYEKLGTRQYRFRCYTDGFLGFQFRIDSFISAIEANGMFWNNPIVKPIRNAFYKTEDFLQSEDEYLEAESKTFHPQQCLILEEIV